MENQESDESWFAVQVRPRYEFKTARMLKSKGFQEFVPSYVSRRQWSDRRINVTLPLFEGYIFCRMCVRKRVPVITTAGVIRIVGSSQGPIPIADQEIEAIQKLTHLAKRVQPHPYALTLPLGSKVRIEKGPLAGIEGVLLEHKNGAELVISVALIQQSFSVEIDGCAVGLVDKPPITMAA